MEPRVCALIPVYNHGATVLAAVRGAARHLPVLVVDDGSTDGAWDALVGEPGVVALRHARNEGKGAALATGLERAAALGYTHVVTLDADGQHDPEDIPTLLAACRADPEAYVLGARDLGAARAPGVRRLANVVARLGVLVATGLWLDDVLTGFRCYPLGRVRTVAVRATRYAWELEILVVLAWFGTRVAQVPVRVDYARETSRRSHLALDTDGARILAVQAQLALQRWLLPWSVRSRMFRRA
jgi:glycosyltransferase involved in cell wall biosynthesis